ncbi:hypothetical protein D3C81_677900 [compost metagenome]
MAVPVHHCHGVTGLDSRLGEHIGQPRDALVEGQVAVAQLIAVDDFAGFLVAAAGQQQALDQQRKLIGALGGRDDASLQHRSPFSRVHRLGKTCPTLERHSSGQISQRNDLAAAGTSGAQPLPLSASR